MIQDKKLSHCKGLKFQLLEQKRKKQEIYLETLKSSQKVHIR